MISCRPRAATPRIVFILLFSCLSATSVVPAPGQAPDSQFLTTARQKYYNLRHEGLGDLEAKIVPDWRVILGRPSPDVATERLLSGLQFSMTIDARTNFRIDHGSQAGAAGNQSMQIARIYANMDQAVTQFVICWSLFQLTSPLPAANSGYGVTRERSGYRFSHHEDRNRVDTTVSDDFKIVEIRTTGPDFVASIRPNLQPTAKGFMLAGWDGQFESGGRQTVVNVQISYQDVSGLQLPAAVYVDTIFQGQPAAAAWSFTDYKIRMVGGAGA